MSESTQSDQPEIPLSDDPLVHHPDDTPQEAYRKAMGRLAEGRRMHPAHPGGPAEYVEPTLVDPEPRRDLGPRKRS
jgi:hypothetical protein